MYAILSARNRGIRVVVLSAKADEGDAGAGGVTTGLDATAVKGFSGVCKVAGVGTDSSSHAVAEVSVASIASGVEFCPPIVPDSPVVGDESDGDAGPFPFLRFFRFLFFFFIDEDVVVVVASDGGCALIEHSDRIVAILNINQNNFL